MTSSRRKGPCTPAKLQVRRKVEGEGFRCCKSQCRCQTFKHRKSKPNFRRHPATKFFIPHRNLESRPHLLMHGVSCCAYGFAHESSAGVVLFQQVSPKVCVHPCCASVQLGWLRRSLSESDTTSIVKLLDDVLVGMLNVSCAGFNFRKSRAGNLLVILVSMRMVEHCPTARSGVSITANLRKLPLNPLNPTS